MENLNNPVEEKIETPIIEDAPVAETPVVDAPAVEEVVSEPAKAQEATEEPSAISTNNFGRSTTEQQAVGSVENGAIGVTSAPKPAVKKAAAKPKTAEEKVAIHSSRNVTWEGVGKIYRGYNIVTKDAADKWLTRNHVRIATPEEVAKEFGK